MDWNVYSGVTFGDKHSYRDWGLFLRERPLFSAPKVKETRIDLMGADGDIDVTEAYGPVRYENVTGGFIFSILGNRRTWESVYSKVKNAIHGRKMQVITDENPEYYYIGRLTVGDMSYRIDSKGGSLTAYIPVTGEFYPYKFSVLKSTDDWLWDPFSFYDGIIKNYSELTVGGETTYTIVNDEMPVVPTFIVTSQQGSIALEFEDETYTLLNGTTKNANIILKAGENELKFSGYGTVTVEFRGGRL